MLRLASIADAERVRITLSNSGRLKVAGPRDAVARVVSGLRPVIEALRSRPYQRTSHPTASSASKGAP
jgi:hypothetical protein